MNVRFILIMVTFLLGVLQLPAQEVAEEDAAETAGAVIPAFREGLVPVPLPDLNKAEKAVAEQLARFQNTLTTIIKSAPDADMEVSNAYGMLGNLYYAYKIRLSAEACYSNAHFLAPDRFAWIYLRGSINQAQGDLEEAKRDFEVAARIKSTYTPLWVNLGDLALGSHLTDEARTHYQKALEANPNSSAAFFGLGQVELQAKNYKEAAEHLEKALELAPEANRIHYSLGTVYRKLGDKNKARSHLALNGKVGVREADPLLDDLNRLLRGERVHMIRGKAAFDARRFGDAEKEYRKAVASAPQSIRARVNLATTLSFLNKTEEAITQFEEILKSDPDNATAHYNLGFLYSNMNQLEKAEDHLLKVIEGNAQDVDARLVLAGVWTQMNKHEQALELYGRIRDVRPLDETAVLNYARLLIAKNDFSTAGQVLNDAQVSMPSSGLISLFLSKFLASCPMASLRNGAKALELARLIVKAQPTYDHLEVLALAYSEVGDCEAAAATQEKALELAMEQKVEDQLKRISAQLAFYRSGETCRPPISQ